MLSLGSTINPRPWAEERSEPLLLTYRCFLAPTQQAESSRSGVARSDSPVHGGTALLAASAPRTGVQTPASALPRAGAASAWDGSQSWMKYPACSQQRVVCPRCSQSQPNLPLFPTCFPSGGLARCAGKKPCYGSPPGGAGTMCK